jgi:polygalacturonase
MVHNVILLGILAVFGVVAAPFEADVEEYGARADGHTFSGGAFNEAIRACALAGGGTVHARAGGAYVAAGIQLRSHVVLSIAPNSSVLGSPDPTRWTRTQADLTIPPECDGTNLMLGKVNGVRLSFPRVLSPGPRGGLFWANLATNFTIRGGGPHTPLGSAAVVSGAGQHFNHDFSHRSCMFTFVQCSNVTVSDLTVRNSSAWTLVPIFSRGVAFRRLHIAQGAHPGKPEHPDHHSNTDGFDPVGSEDCSFEDSFYEGPGDDCVAIKSGVQVNWTVPYYNVCKRPSRRIYVNNVTCVAAHGITIGSEVSGGIEDIRFTNMRLFASTGNGVAMVKLKNACGRGAFVRNIHWENLTGGDMGDGISAGRYGTPETVNSCNDTGTIRFSNMTAKNIFVESAVFSAFNVVGYKSPSAQQQFEGFKLDNFTVKRFKTVGKCENAAVHLIGHISPAFPPCTNSTAVPHPKPKPPPAKNHCTIRTNHQRCFDDTARGSLLPVPEPSTHDKVTLVSSRSFLFFCFDVVRWKCIKKHPAQADPPPLPPSPLAYNTPIRLRLSVCVL